ncbi:hypothetical protein PRABACTJOHN_00984 [Parabacteroides johnsonii DSM 18315]|uniref:Uncharacterized protein n=1 Tax=Parabacteroides johnsonii DSM 18315 TaxID=537006 RepID=B7B7I6_9BACT|nr:hypothetical protein PRABACTJOHN_00984 [Parabacteroides johnsonii DSM 18315]
MQGKLLFHTNETLFPLKYFGTAIRFFGGFGNNVLIYYYLCSHSLKIIV